MSKLKKALTLSFLADSLALSGHWIYDQNILAKHNLEQLEAPLIKDYHPQKQKGELTHYGDQTLVLLESLAAKKQFDLEDFASRWQKLFTNYSDYIDHATRITLENFGMGWGPEDSGSMMKDLAGASRIFPLFLVYDQLEELEEAANLQTAMTHKHVQVVEASSFFTRLAYALNKKEDINQALSFALEKNFANLPAQEWVKKAQEVLPLDANKALLKLGQTCHLDEAFPSTIYLLLKFFANPEEGLIANVKAGGDSAARGLVLGFCFGLKKEADKLISLWIKDFKLKESLNKLLEQF